MEILFSDAMHILSSHTLMISCAKLCFHSNFCNDKRAKATKNQLTQIHYDVNAKCNVYNPSHLMENGSNPGELTKLLLLLKCQKNCERDENNQLLTFRLHHS